MKPKMSENERLLHEQKKRYAEPHYKDVLHFLEARCEKADGEKILSKDLYTAYKVWAKSMGEYVLSARKFNAELERHPEWFEKKTIYQGYPSWNGLKLKETI